MTVEQFLSKPYELTLDQGHIICESPSNIALVKYWGKFANQMPANPSISFTLNNCKSITSLDFKKKLNTNDYSFNFYFEGEKKPAFEEKIQIFLQRISIYFIRVISIDNDSKNCYIGLVL